MCRRSAEPIDVGLVASMLSKTIPAAQVTEDTQKTLKHSTRTN